MSTFIEYLIEFVLSGAYLGIMLLAAFGVVTAGTFAASVIWHGMQFCFQVWKRKKWMREHRRSNDETA